MFKGDVDGLLLRHKKSRGEMMMVTMIKIVLFIGMTPSGT
jgi:hypothetical protein